MDNGKRGLRRDQKLLLVLAAIFFVPVLVSWVWFLNVDEFRPQGSVANGTLIEPVRVLGDYTLDTVAGREPVSAASLQGRWVMVFIGGADCDEHCRDRLYGMRQVDTALGRDAGRVERLYVQVGRGATELIADRPRLQVARLAADSPWLAQFDFGDGVPQATGRVYLVDPLGNLMLRWEPDAAHRDFLDDLKRLLRISQIG